MRQWIYAATASLALLSAASEANAFSVDRLTSTTVASDVETVQFVFGGRRYCWYDSGWQGPGFYWCGYAWRRGSGWGGGAGWRGWHHRPGHVIGRPVRPPHVGGPGRPGGPGHIGRPGGRPGGGGHGGGGHGGGHRH